MALLEAQRPPRELGACGLWARAPSSVDLCECVSVWVCEPLGPWDCGCKVSASRNVWVHGSVCLHVRGSVDPHIQEDVG